MSELLSILLDILKYIGIRLLLIFFGLCFIVAGILHPKFAVHAMIEFGEKVKEKLEEKP